jgi:hypothetical protein
MKKFTVKFLREFEVEIEAENGAHAKNIAERILTQFPAGTCKLLSLVAEDYTEQPCQGCLDFGPIKSEVGTPPRGGHPNGGGSPGTPIIRTEEIVDQIAAAA